MDMPSEAGILAGLDPEQREVATTFGVPVRVLAGAGTGKTRAVTHRIAHGVQQGRMNPTGVLALTFTTRAASEMRSRLQMLGVGGVQSRTFHAAALRQVMYFWPLVVGGPPPLLMKEKASALVEAARRVGVPLDRGGVRDIAAEIEWAKVQMMTPEAYRTGASGRGEPGGLDALSISRIYHGYEQVKTERHGIDFEDVLLLTVAMLEEHPRVKGQIQGQYRHFVVDEYQDVSPLQQRLLKLWIGDRPDICVVGDPSQTIYSFSGATYRHLMEFDRDFPEARTVKLIRDYRSTPEVVDLANKVLGRAQGGQAPLTLVSQRGHGPRPEFTEYADEEAEAQGVAAAVRALIDSGTPAKDIAVLFRVNSQSEPFEQALAQQGVGYVLKGGERFFNRSEVRSAMAQIRTAAATSTEGSPTELVASLLGSLGYSSQPPAATGALREKWESLQAIVTMVSLMEESRQGGAPLTLRHVSEELAARAAAQHAPAIDGVTLASLHAAKGLEWEAVFLVGLREGLLPISYAETPENIEEERRLLYVGVTRARTHLRLSWPISRSGGKATRQPSRFLDGLRPVEAAAPGGVRSERAASRRGTGGKGRARQVCRGCGRELVVAAEVTAGRCSRCPATYDEALFEKLRAWRSATAVEQKVAPYLVFSNATLRAIAEDPPAAREDLNRVSGIGKMKYEQYAQAIFDIVSGE